MKRLYLDTKVIILFVILSIQIFMNKNFAMEISPKSHCSNWTQSLTDSENDLRMYLRDTGSIIWSSLQSPKEVAAFSASSPWVINTILSHIKERTKILEIGAGAGTISIPLLDRYNLERYDGVELEQELFMRFKEKIEEKNYFNAHIYNQNFIDWNPGYVNFETQNGFYDTIISTIPITRLPYSDIKKILNKVEKLLKTGGIFIYVSLAGARSLGHWIGFFETIFCHPQNWIDYNKKLKFIDTWVRENFDQEEVLILRNFTPMRIYFAVKK